MAGVCGGRQGAISIRQAMGHLACIPVTDFASEGDFYDYEMMVTAIARQKSVVADR